MKKNEEKKYEFISCHERLEAADLRILLLQRSFCSFTWC